MTTTSIIAFMIDVGNCKYSKINIVLIVKYLYTYGPVEEEAVANWSKRDFPLILISFNSNQMVFYHSSFTIEHTGTVECLYFLWFLSKK